MLHVRFCEVDVPRSIVLGFLFARELVLLTTLHKITAMVFHIMKDCVMTMIFHLKNSTAATSPHGPNLSPELKGSPIHQTRATIQPLLHTSRA